MCVLLVRRVRVIDVVVIVIRWVEGFKGVNVIEDKKNFCMCVLRCGFEYF